MKCDFLWRWEAIKLNTKIEELKKFLKEYYTAQIEEKLFEFELLK